MLLPSAPTVLFWPPAATIARPSFGTSIPVSAWCDSKVIPTAFVILPSVQTARVWSPAAMMEPSVYGMYERGNTDNYFPIAPYRERQTASAPWAFCREPICPRQTNRQKVNRAKTVSSPLPSRPATIAPYNCAMPYPESVFKPLENIKVPFGPRLAAKTVKSLPAATIAPCDSGRLVPENASTPFRVSTLKSLLWLSMARVKSWSRVARNGRSSCGRWERVCP